MKKMDNEVTNDMEVTPGTGEDSTPSVNAGVSEDEAADIEKMMMAAEESRAMGTVPVVPDGELKREEAEEAAATDSAAVSASDVSITEEVAVDEEDVDPDLIQRGEQQALQTATRRQRRRTYNDSQDIVPDGDALQIHTHGQMLHDTFLDLTASLRGRAIRRGTIVAAYQRGDGQAPAAMLIYNGYKVIIPFNELIPEDRIPSEYRGDERSKLNFMLLMINWRINSEISFIVKGVDENARIAVASRLEAMTQERYTYFWRRGRQNGAYAISEGSRAEARVQYVLQRVMCVEIHGLEVVLRSEDVSYIHLNDLRSAYTPGDLVPVKFVRLRRDTQNGARILDASINIKDAQPNPNELYYDMFPIGSRVPARVTHVDENGIYVMLANTREGKCYFTRGDNNVPKVGEQLMVRVVRKNDETFFIDCEIVQRFAARKFTL